MPKLLLQNTLIPYTETKTHIKVQKGDLSTDLTLRLWNLYILKICLRSIIELPIKKEYYDILVTIANYLNVHINYDSLTVKPMGYDNEPRRSIGT